MLVDGEAIDDDGRIVGWNWQGGFRVFSGVTLALVSAVTLRCGWKWYG